MNNPPLHVALGTPIFDVANAQFPLRLPWKNPNPTHISNVCLDSLISQDPAQLFRVRASLNDEMIYVRTAEGQDIVPTPFFYNLFNAAGALGLTSLSLENISEWIYRLTITSGLNEHYFFKELEDGSDKIPYTPSLRELSKCFGIEFHGNHNLTNAEFDITIRTRLARRTALDIQSTLNSTLPSIFAREK